MGKEGDLWDDSALITAFDDAISNYKKMHRLTQLDDSKAGEQEINGTGEALFTCIDENNDAKRQAEEDSNKDITSQLKPDLQEISNENQNKHSHQGYPSTQCAEDYNQLLKQYNEIEGQRQKILQQLQHLNYWNSQESGPSQHWESWCSPQQYPVTKDQMTIQTNRSDFAPPCYVPPYDPYYNQCMVAPCYLGGTCTSETSGTTCNAQSTFIEDSNVTKAALGAAEKAMFSLKIENPEKQEEGREAQLEAGAIGEPDLNVVFNAWYTAGFYTGKYLGEHSITKKH